MEAERTTTPVRRPRKRRRNLGLTVIGIFGELLLTAGVLVFLFLGWQLWLNDIIVGNQQNTSALELSKDWERTPAPVPSPSDTPDADEPDDHEPDDGAEQPQSSPLEPVSTIEVTPGKGFATIYIPRFGADYVRAIGEGVELSAVLNKRDLGVGHYPDTQLPGQVGNFAIAAHRTTWGAPFNQIAELRQGDKIYVQTADGWYTYSFRNLEYVLPTGVDVLEPVPQAPSVEGGDRLLTMTSCNPMFSAQERIVSYSVLSDWQPASAGMPAPLAALRGES